MTHPLQLSTFYFFSQLGRSWVQHRPSMEKKRRLCAMRPGVLQKSPDTRSLLFPKRVSSLKTNLNFIPNIEIHQSKARCVIYGVQKVAAPSNRGVCQLPSEFTPLYFNKMGSNQATQKKRYFRLNAPGDAPKGLHVHVCRFHPKWSFFD